MRKKKKKKKKRKIRLSYFLESISRRDASAPTPWRRQTERNGDFNSQKEKKSGKKRVAFDVHKAEKKEEEERGIPGEYQFKTTFRRIPRIAYTYAVLFVIPFHQPLGPGCCFIISFLPCTPLSLPRRRPICLCAHRYYACCIMHCAARWTYARMRAPTSLPKMPRSGGARCRRDVSGVEDERQFAKC